MLKLITFFVLFSQFLIFGQQQTEFIEITNIQLDKRPSRDIKLTDTLTIRHWTKLDEKRKKRVKKGILELQQDIIRDSSKTSKIIFFGKAENIKLITGDSILVNTYLNEVSQKYFYWGHSVSNLANYELVTINRNQGILDIELFLLDSKRTAKFKIDTSFSEIYIHASLVFEYSELQDSEETEEIPMDADGLPIEPEFIEVMEDDFDQLSVHHRIPRKKHYW